MALGLDGAEPMVEIGATFAGALSEEDLDRDMSAIEVTNRLTRNASAAGPETSGSVE